MSSKMTIFSIFHKKKLEMIGLNSLAIHLINAAVNSSEAVAVYNCSVSCWLQSVMGTVNLSFYTKAITIIDKLKKALGDTDNIIDKFQFFEAISVIDKLSPINFSDKCCGKFSMCLTKFFVSQIAKMFF